VEEGMNMLKALAPDAHISISGKPLAFPMGHSDEPLKAYIGDYGQMPLKSGIEETFKSFQQLLKDKKIDASQLQ